MSGHQFAFTDISGAGLPMSRYRGQPVLLVNTASECGFTPQYAGLQALWERYRERGLVVLGVPSNDFGAQEPADEDRIRAFCSIGYGVDFPMTSKQHVIGEQAHPLYRWIREQLGEAGAPRWNFHKYLLSPDGELAGAWPSKIEPTDPDVVDAVGAVLQRHG